jgi:hypothetical protein
MRRDRWARWRADDGRVTAFVAVMMAGIVAVAGLGLDGGLALAAKVAAEGQAEAAARAGAQAIDLAAYRGTGALKLVPAQAETSAQSYLARVGAVGAVTTSEESVTVTVTATVHTQLLGMVGVSALTVHGQGSARPERGVLTIEP